MATTISGTTITFNDNTTQISAPRLPIWAGNNFQVFNSPGQFTVPTGVNEIYTVIAGGGGGGTSLLPALYGTRGGAAGVGFLAIHGVNPGQTVPVTVGTAGAGGPWNVAGQSGNASSLGNFVTANGGQGGPGNSPANGADGNLVSPAGQVFPLFTQLGVATGGSGNPGFAYSDPYASFVGGGGGGAGFHSGGGGGTARFSVPSTGGAAGSGLGNSTVGLSPNMIANGGQNGQAWPGSPAGVGGAGGAGGGNTGTSNGGAGGAAHPFGMGGGGGGGAARVVVFW